ncbi:MAG: Qat anti-phage system TatD family nuclease QatD [Hyphomonadaceae bacterium]
MIDFHCHLDLYQDPHGIVRECKRRGVYVLSVTTTPSAFRGTVALADGAPRIRTALGLHPQLVAERKFEFPLFEELLPQARYVGEIGLDGGPECKTFWDDQVIIFEKALAACAAQSGRVYSVHSRRAAGAVLDSIAKFPNAGVPILHWYSGTTRELERASALGCWFSVGPAMLRSAKGRALATKMPRDRVLTETDGPFARIERDGAPLHPWDAAQAHDELALAWGMETDRVGDLISRNLRRLGASSGVDTNG